MSAAEFKPLHAWDLSEENPEVIKNRLRALEREIRDGFDRFKTGTVSVMERMVEQLATLIDGVDEIRAAQSRAELRQRETEARLMLLELAGAEESER